MDMPSGRSVYPAAHDKQQVRMAERREGTCKGTKEALSGGQEGKRRSFTLTDGYQSGEEKKGKRRRGEGEEGEGEGEEEEGDQPRVSSTSRLASDGC